MVSELKIFVGKWSKIAAGRKESFFFLADFSLQNMVETTLPDGLETFLKSIQFHCHNLSYVYITLICLDFLNAFCIDATICRHLNDQVSPVCGISFQIRWKKQHLLRTKCPLKTYSYNLNLKQLPWCHPHQPPHPQAY